MPNQASTKPNHNKTVSRKIFYLVIALLVIVLVAAACIMAHNAYHQGYIDGQSAQKSDTTENLNALATAISEKSATNANLKETLKSLPDELDQAAIADYQKALNTLLENATDDEVKNNLKTLLDQWNFFQTVYDSEDNEKIDAEFETLKTTTSETADKLQTYYDAKIKSALENL